MLTYPLGVNGLVTRVLEAGDGDDTVILIHGVGARADRWRQNVEGLAAGGYHVYAFDLPGHGFATKSADFDYTISGYASFVEALTAALDIERMCLVGTSLGAHIAGHLTCARPHHVRALIMVGALGLEVLGDRGAGLAEGIRDISRAGITAKLKFLLANEDLITPGWVEEEARVNSSPGANQAFALLSEYLRDGIDEDLIITPLMEVSETVPTLLIWGAEDAAVPASIGRRAANLLPRACFQEIEGTGHAPYLEKPDHFNQCVLQFLADAHERQRKERRRG